MCWTQLSPPCEGAWIEARRKCPRPWRPSGRPLVRGRGLKHPRFVFVRFFNRRPLVRGRGLKHQASGSDHPAAGRPLVRGRGLKLFPDYILSCDKCRPLVRGRGLKHGEIARKPDGALVAPL